MIKLITNEPNNFIEYTLITDYNSTYTNELSNYLINELSIPTNKPVIFPVSKLEEKFGLINYVNLLKDLIENKKIQQLSSISTTNYRNVYYIFN